MSKSKVFSRFGIAPAVVGLTIGLSVAATWAAEFQAGALRVIDPKATPSRPGVTTSGAYLSISNRGPSADTLLKVSTTIAGSVEIHTMKMDGDVMKMREIGPVTIAVGQTVTMGAASPDGLHLMLMGVKQPLKVGDVFPLTLEFKNAGRTDVTVTVSNDARGVPAAGVGGSAGASPGGAMGGGAAGHGMAGHKQ